MKIVLRLPRLEVIGLDPDHDVLHDESPSREVESEAYESGRMENDDLIRRELNSRDLGSGAAPPRSCAALDLIGRATREQPGRRDHECRAHEQRRDVQHPGEHRRGDGRRGEQRTGQAIAVHRQARRCEQRSPRPTRQATSTRTRASAFTDWSTRSPTTNPTTAHTTAPTSITRRLVIRSLRNGPSRAHRAPSCP